MKFIIILIIFIVIIYIISNNKPNNNLDNKNELFLDNINDNENNHNDNNDNYDIDNIPVNIDNTIIKYKFIIYTQNIGLLIAESIGHMLKKLNIDYTIVFEITIDDIKLNRENPYELFIILFPQTL